MSKNCWAFVAIIAALCFCMVCGCTSDAAPADDAGQITTEEKSLVVYSGAGLREPMDEIAKVYENKTGTVIKYTYAGSAQLLSQIELLQEGDCFMPGARADLDTAIEKGFITNNENVIYHVLAFAVQPGNPKNITCLKDLTEDGVRVAIGDPTAIPVGKATKKIYEKAGLWEDLQDNIVTTTGTVNELVVYMNMNQADASMIWEDLLDSSNVEQVDIPQEEGFIKVVPISTLSFSEKPAEAQAFADFIASDEGKAIFVEYGFDTYPSAKYGDA